LEIWQGVKSGSKRKDKVSNLVPKIKHKVLNVVSQNTDKVLNMRCYRTLGGSRRGGRVRIGSGSLLR